MLKGLSAIAIEGAKGVGKTALSTQRAQTVMSLDDPFTAQNVRDNPDLVLSGSRPTFIDEWQLVPSVWDVVRHAVDNGAPAASFLLAGSAMPPAGARLHSGAGRIVRAMLRPLTIPERGIEKPTVSLAELLAGGQPAVGGRSKVTSSDYVDEILATGFPGIRGNQSSEYLVASYLDRIVDHDIPESGGSVRRPTAVRNWLAAYAAATATTASYTTILDAATPGEGTKPNQQTAAAYRELLQRIWVLDPLPAWEPGFSHLERLSLAPKHHLVDPGLAAALVGATRESLIRGEGPAMAPRDGTFLGALFESLAVQTIRVLAELYGARAAHMRVRGGDHEVDVILQRRDFKVLAIEVKFSSVVRPADVRHLNWLQQKLPDQVLDKVLINTSSFALRRPDGVVVVPLALLGL